MEKIILIDGNSILNRAFYGIMGNKMLMTSDGTYTNAVYGFLAILFKIIEDINPEYIAVAFDLKEPTFRHKLYSEYKGTRKGMPQELAEQLPIIKEVLKAMNIKMLELAGYEADDIIGTMAKESQKQGLDVIILSGDRDNFQLIDTNILVRIPRTKAGKTQQEDFDKNKILDVYGVKPEKLIDVKGLMGDPSDNIPGVPGVGEKTAIGIIKEYESIENLYKNLKQGTDTLKGKLREKLIENEELAYLSKQLGTIKLNVPLEEQLQDFKIQNWNNEKVLELFKKLSFNKYIEKFKLNSNIIEDKETKDLFEVVDIKESNVKILLEKINSEKQIVYYFGTKEYTNNMCIIKRKIVDMSIYNEKENIVYYISSEEAIVKYIKDILENEKIKKYGNKQKQDYILLKQIGIETRGFYYDAEIASYILNPTNSNYNIEKLIQDYSNIDINQYLKSENCQISLFDEEEKELEVTEKQVNNLYAYCIYIIYKNTIKKIEKIEQLDLFNNIEMPLVKILAKMQYNGIHIDKKELIEYGKILKIKIEELTQEIYKFANKEFNINSTKQLAEVLFEDLKLPSYKKTKTGFSTDVDVLEKIKSEHEIVEKILDYRQLVKLNSTYVEGLLPYINENSGRIHSYFHQTVTATGRISSSAPNLQNIPTRIEIGKKLRKVFKPSKNCIFIDADYSQIELRVLAHISNDSNMIEAFKNNEDIHMQVASKVFGVELKDVTKQQRTEAKAVNFGIVYGISDYGLSEQLGISMKLAKTYIEQYLEKYKGIREFMESIVKNAKELGYVETLFKRRRYVPELKSNNYMVRQFGSRVALNTPIQGTAADIMKLAMVKVDEELNKRNLKSKIVLQVHDEILLETLVEEKEEVKKIIIQSMENVVNLKIPLVVDISEATSWYDCN